MNKATQIKSVRAAMAAFLALGLTSLAPAYAQNEDGRIETQPRELEGVGITEHLNDTLPMSLSFKDDNGNEVLLADYFKSDRPTILVLGYYSCPMLCNLMLNGMLDGMKSLSWSPGKEFQIIMISINPLETPRLAKVKKQNYVKEYGRPESADGWHFLVGSKSNIQAVADAVGFGFKLVPDTNPQEYAHTAGLFILTPDGTISRVLYGIQYLTSNLKLALLEASEGKIGTTVDRIVMYCFHYDSASGNYAPVAANMVKLGGAATVILLAIFLGGTWLTSARSRSGKKLPQAH